MRLEVEEYHFPHATVKKAKDWDKTAYVFCQKLQQQDKNHLLHGCRNGLKAVYESRDDFNKSTPRCFWMTNRNLRYLTCEQCLSHEHIQQQTRSAVLSPEKYTQTPLFILAQSGLDNKDSL